MKHVNAGFTVQRAKRRRRTGIAALIGGAIAAVVLKFLGFGQPPNPPPAKRAPMQAQTAPPARSQQPQPATTDVHYILALSLAPAFCETAPRKKQCQQLDSERNRQTPLTLHGLWPSSVRGNQALQYCAGEKLRLKEIDSDRLRRFMPGVSDGLASHEWNKHGTCSGLSAAQYFQNSVDWTERSNAALQDLINLGAGKSVDTQAFRAGINQVMPGLAPSLTLHCKNLPNANPALRGVPVLVEIRACLSRKPDGQVGEWLECASLDQIDQGCGKRFAIDLP